jgi:hypothetical protein
LKTIIFCLTKGAMVDRRRRFWFGRALPVVDYGNTNMVANLECAILATNLTK